jgi:hypothetical protein
MRDRSNRTLDWSLSETLFQDAREIEQDADEELAAFTLELAKAGHARLALGDHRGLASADRRLHAKARDIRDPLKLLVEWTHYHKLVLAMARDQRARGAA